MLTAIERAFRLLEEHPGVYITQAEIGGEIKLNPIGGKFERFPSLEDENILRYLSFYREELKLRPEKWPEITDKCACIITAYMRGRESVR
jgi:hypothetical protein